LQYFLTIHKALKINKLHKALKIKQLSDELMMIENLSFHSYSDDCDDISLKKTRI
jgi:hypothetical protein